MSTKRSLVSLTAAVALLASLSPLTSGARAEKPKREIVVEVTEAGPTDRLNEPNAGNQKNSKSDLAITAKIRRAVVSDRSLSFRARNVAIITQGGVVTLRGGVKSKLERAAVEQKAMQIAGPEAGRNELSGPN